MELVVALSPVCCAAYRRGRPPESSRIGGHAIQPPCLLFANLFYCAACFRYNQATGRTYYPSQPGEQRGQRWREQQPEQGLSMGSGVCDVAQPDVPTGSYFNPLAAEMAAGGVFIQVRADR